MQRVRALTLCNPLFFSVFTSVSDPCDASTAVHSFSSPQRRRTGAALTSARREGASKTALLLIARGPSPGALGFFVSPGRLSPVADLKACSTSVLVTPSLNFLSFVVSFCFRQLEIALSRAETLLLPRLDTASTVSFSQRKVHFPCSGALLIERVMYSFSWRSIRWQPAASFKSKLLTLVSRPLVSSSFCRSVQYSTGSLFFAASPYPFYSDGKELLSLLFPNLKTHGCFFLSITVVLSLVIYTFHHHFFV